MGYDAESGPGNATSNYGAAHGGHGGATYPHTGGIPYDSLYKPKHQGSGGGSVNENGHAATSTTSSCAQFGAISSTEVNMSGEPWLYTSLNEGETKSYTFDELDLRGHSNLIIDYPDVGIPVEVIVHEMQGDLTGLIHIRVDQTLYIKGVTFCFSLIQ
jgi:hypothetical protein